MPVWASYSRARVRNSSVFDTASTAFELLVSGPEPLTVQGWLFEGFPGRPVPLDEVGRLLLGRGCAAATKDAVWAHLVGRSRQDGGAWTVGCVGLALPGLIICARKLAVWVPDAADVHAAVLTGFLSGLATLELGTPWVLNRLMGAARRAGTRAAREELSAPTPVAEGLESRQPPAPWGHPDLVLAEAVADGVITGEQADMIGATRLEEVCARDYATAHGIGYGTLLRTRLRAERRLVSWLTEGRADQVADGHLEGPTAPGGGHRPDHRGDHRCGPGGAAREGGVGDKTRDTDE